MRERVCYRKKRADVLLREVQSRPNRDAARERDRQKREDVRNRRKKKASLKDISNKARELGMSYGMYVAQMEMQKVSGQ